jgi:uncharacterized protein YlxW (UPF0749 family)
MEPWKYIVRLQEQVATMQAEIKQLRQLIDDIHLQLRENQKIFSQLHNAITDDSTGSADETD